MNITRILWTSGTFEIEFSDGVIVNGTSQQLRDLIFPRMRAEMRPAPKPLDAVGLDFNSRQGKISGV